MGTSDAVATLTKHTPELVGVIKLQMKAMDEAMGEVISAFPPFVADFYSKNKWDQQLMGQEVRQDLQQESVFSLDKITTVITTIALETCCRRHWITGWCGS